MKQILKEMELLLLNYDYKDFIEETKKRISNKEKLLKETVVKKEAKKLKKKWWMRVNMDDFLIQNQW